MEKLAIISIYYCLSFVSAFAQNNLVSFEYWFDSNYVTKVDSPITPPVSSYTINSGIPLTRLSVGLHTFNIRFLDDSSRYTNVISSYFFYSSGNISFYQYWFDNDFANKVDSSVTPIQTLNLSQPVNVSSVSSGFHAFNIRFRDAVGVWSSVESSYFIKLGVSGVGNEITAYRYWIDNGDTAIVNFVLSSPSASAIILDSVITLSLDTGYHKIHFQVKDNSDLWSGVLTKTFRRIGNPRLDYINPNTGGNIGYVTANIYGDGFYDNAIVQLIKPGDTITVPDSMKTFQFGNRIQATFDLHGADTGYYNLVVTIPGDTIMILLNGFHVVEGIPAQVWCNVIGPANVRTNTFGNFSLAFGNNGNVDAVGVPIWLAIPFAAIFDFDFTISNPIDSVLDYDTIPSFTFADTIDNQSVQENVFQFFLLSIPPGAVGNLNFRLKLSTSGLNQVFCGLKTPLYGSPLSPDFTDCMEDIITSIWLGLPQDLPLAPCLYSAYDNIVTLYRESPLNGNNTSFTHPDYILNYSKSLASMVLTCTVDALHGFITLPALLKATYHSADFVDFATDCVPTVFTLLYNSKVYNTVFSVDPNEKYGPVGLDTTTNYVNHSVPLEYIIKFENDSSASARVQTLLIVDSLNQTFVDSSTFSFSNIKISSHTLLPVPNAKTFSDVIDLSSESNVLVRVTMHYNDTVGVLTWLFQSLDPNTMQPVTDPLLGFLPPNITSPDGEGFVAYSIKLKDSLQLNSQIHNRAYIYFDSNPAEVTGTWTNTIDNVKPVSHVNALPPIQNDTTIHVSWSGSDAGSGLLKYSVFYSVNGGAFHAWVINTTNTSQDYFGSEDSTYCFYSVAIDSASNIEQAPLSSDACITIITGLKSLNNQLSGFKVYPNPSLGNFTLEFYSDKFQKAEVDVYDLLGKHLFSEEIVFMIGINKRFIRLEDFAFGVYVIEIKTSESSGKGRLVIN